MENDNWYPPLRPHPVDPGLFDIYVFGSEKNQLSGCAYEIRHSGTGTVLESSEPLITEREVSSQWRAHLAAVVRAVERLPNGSQATICSYNEALLNLIRDIDFYQDAGWRKSNKKPLSDLEIVLRIARARDGDSDHPRNIKLTIKLSHTAIDSLIIYRLREKVLVALKARKSGRAA